MQYSFDRAMSILVVGIALDIQPSAIIDAAKYILEYKSEKIPDWVCTVAETQVADWKKVRPEIIEKMSEV